MILWYIGASCSETDTEILTLIWRRLWYLYSHIMIYPSGNNSLRVLWKCEIRLWGQCSHVLGDNALIRFTNFVLTHRAAQHEFLSVSMTIVVATVYTWTSVATKSIGLTPLREGRVARCSCIGRIRHFKAFALLSSSVGVVQSITVKLSNFVITT